MGQSRSPGWRIDRKIPVRVWIAIGGIAIAGTMLGNVMLGGALTSYKAPLAQYASAHADIDEDQYRALQPVPAPSEAAYLEGTLGAWLLGLGLLLGLAAGVVRLSKVRVRWLFPRALVALIVAIYSGVTFANAAPSVFFKFMYVNSTDCVGGCYFTPDPLGAWLSLLAIAATVGALSAAGLLLTVVVRIALAKSSGTHA